MVELCHFQINWHTWDWEINKLYSGVGLGPVHNDLLDRFVKF